MVEIKLNEEQLKEEYKRACKGMEPYIDAFTAMQEKELKDKLMITDDIKDMKKIQAQFQYLQSLAILVKETNKE